LFPSIYQEYDKCLEDVLKETPSPVPDVFLVFGVEAYQISYLLNKTKYCPGIKYDDLKGIVLQSGRYVVFLLESTRKE